MSISFLNGFSSTSFFAREAVNLLALVPAPALAPAAAAEPDDLFACGLLAALASPDLDYAGLFELPPFLPPLAASLCYASAYCWAAICCASF